MADTQSARLDLGELLAAVEDAPPVAAVDVLDNRLRKAIGADDVSFSDRRLQRSGADPARARREQAGRSYAGP